MRMSKELISYYTKILNEINENENYRKEEYLFKFNEKYYRIYWDGIKWSYPIEIVLMKEL